MKAEQKREGGPTVGERTRHSGNGRDESNAAQTLIADASLPRTDGSAKAIGARPT